MFTPDDECCPHCGQRLGLEWEVKMFTDWLTHQPEATALAARFCEVIEENAIPLDEFFDRLKSEADSE